jgi:sortase (surface protein transpeptidase)
MLFPIIFLWTSVFSTHFNIINEVKAGDEIFVKSLEDILELEDFYSVGDSFGFKVLKNLDEYQWKEFKRIIFEMKESIEKKGLIEKGL